MNIKIKSKSPLKRRAVAVFFVLVTVCALLFSGCNAKPEYFSYVSELRKDVFVGENERFAVSVWAGAREQPYAADGIKNPTSLSLTVKVTQKQESGDNLNVNIKFDDKTYSAKTGFHPVKSALCAEIAVDKLPEKQVIIEIEYGEEIDCITLESMLLPTTISYTAALDKAICKAEEFLKANTKNAKLEAEITVKLLCENNRNYYYVCFLSVTGEKLAYLIDGENGEVLAEKQR